MKLLTNKTEITLLLMTSYYIIHIYTGYNWQIAPFINPPFLKKKVFKKKKKNTTSHLKERFMDEAKISLTLHDQPCNGNNILEDAIQ